MDLYLKETLSGKGVFSKKNFKKGDKLIEFKGEIYTEGNYPSDFYDDVNFYLQIGLGKFMGPSQGLDDYFNHSCDPNSAIFFEDKVVLRAIKDIKTDEEIVWDYSITEDENGEWSMECLCNSPKCRGIIGDFKLLPKEKQQEYIQMGLVPQYILDTLK